MSVKAKLVFINNNNFITVNKEFQIKGKMLNCYSTGSFISFTDVPRDYFWLASYVYVGVIVLVIVGLLVIFNQVTLNWTCIFNKFQVYKTGISPN